MMKNRLANLTLPVLNVQNKENLQETIDRKNYFLYPNKNGFKRLRVIFENKQQGILEYENERGTHQIFFGIGKHRNCLFPEYRQLCVSSATWCDRDTLYICSQLTDELVAAIHFKLVFSENGTLTLMMKKTEETQFNEFQGVLTASL